MQGLVNDGNPKTGNKLSNKLIFRFIIQGLVNVGNQKTGNKWSNMFFRLNIQGLVNH